MKRSITSGIVAVALATGAVALGAPASALTVNLGSRICQTYEYPTATTAKSTRGGCDSVRSRIMWFDTSAGVIQVRSGSWGSSSTAYRTTPGYVISRSVNVRVGSSETGFMSY